MIPFDFRVEWCQLAEELPIKGVPVLVCSPRLFMHMFNVCFYDGATRWVIFGAVSNLASLKARDSDYWAYLPDYI